jgi:hypothetical protein
LTVTSVIRVASEIGPLGGAARFPAGGGDRTVAVVARRHFVKARLVVVQVSAALSLEPGLESWKPKEQMPIKLSGHLLAG